MESRGCPKRVIITVITLTLILIYSLAVSLTAHAEEKAKNDVQIDLVFITLDDIVCAENLRVDMDETPSLDFDYTIVPGDINVGNAVWTIKSSNPTVDADQFATVDGTGTVSFHNPTPISEPIILTCSVDGVESVPVEIDIRKDTPELTGIKTRYNPLYISESLNSVDIFENLVPEPSEALLSARSTTVSVDNKAFSIDNGTGILKFNGSGSTETNVYVESLENPEVNASFKIIRSAATNAVGLTTQDNLSLGKDSAPVNVQARLMPVDTTDGLDYDFTYESSDDKIATVDSNGYVTPWRIGSAVITTTATKRGDSEEIPTTFVSTTQVEVINTIPINGISVDTPLVELTTIPTGKTQHKLDVHLDPANTTQTKLTYTSLAPTVAMVDENGLIVALAEGKTTITVTDENNHQTLVQVNVSNNKIVTDYITVTAMSPDEFTVLAKNIHPNPALAVQGSNIESVTCFAFSDKPTKGDLNAKRMVNEDGTTDWKITLPVNDNGEHNFFEKACAIHLHIYASDNKASDGDLVGYIQYDYVTYGTSPTNVTVTPYVEDIGFMTPSVGSDAIAGTLGKNLQMEGIRIASPINDINLTYGVHVSDIGWLDDVPEGVFAGTMGMHKGLEAVRIDMSGPASELYTLTYRAYVRGQGWTAWMPKGEVAGTIGEAKPIEAMQISIQKK